MSFMFQVCKFPDSRWNKIGCGIIEKQRNQILLYEVPLTLISDDGPQFSCVEFKQFNRDFLSTYAHSNGIPQKHFPTVER